MIPLRVANVADDLYKPCAYLHEKEESEMVAASSAIEGARTFEGFLHSA